MHFGFNNTVRGMVIRDAFASASGLATSDSAVSESLPHDDSNCMETHCWHCFQSKELPALKHDQSLMAKSPDVLEVIGWILDEAPEFLGTGATVAKLGCGCGICYKYRCGVMPRNQGTKQARFEAKPFAKEHLKQHMQQSCH